MVPQQALYSMNSPFVIEQARALAARLDVAGTSSTTEGRIAALYRIALGRAPTPLEGRAATRYIDSPGKVPGEPGRSQLSRWEQLAQVLLMTNEFLFID
jgi:hypothetical protein